MENELHKEAARWLRQAESDYSFLEIAKKAQKYDIVCFLSQQVAEKALKAYLYFRKEEAIFTHSIFKLCAIASQHDGEFAGLQSKIKNLDHFYAEARYPNTLVDVIPVEFFNQQDAEDAIRMAKNALDFVKIRITDQ